MVLEQLDGHLKENEIESLPHTTHKRSTSGVLKNGKETHKSLFMFQQEDGYI
jgi:hypothetical protein